METELILGLSVAGMALGVIEGIKPGPLLTMVIRETLAGGLGAGAAPSPGPLLRIFYKIRIQDSPWAGLKFSRPDCIVHEFDGFLDMVIVF